MYRIGDKEIERLDRAVRSGRLFRYDIGQECARFEKRYARQLGVKHCALTSSGTTALTAALVGLGIGPGDEVLVPACTYMATAVAVLAVGAIPVIVDIDDSITLDPDAMAEMIGPRTRAVIPVHMWGLPCDMGEILRIARKRKVYVVEDACQGVGGAYEGRMLGSMGDMGAFSFNYFKNMCCGEGGAVVSNNSRWMKRAFCSIDCCGFYWSGDKRDDEGFTFSGSRASELEGAVLNAQLDRIGPMIRAMRRQKKRVLKETASVGLQPIRANSLDSECGTHVMYLLPSAEAADGLARKVDGTVALKTGRHVYTEWDPILKHHGAHHPALNPFNLQENRGCRMDYAPDMCARSLDILSRTVFITTHPDFTASDIADRVRGLKAAARELLGNGVAPHPSKRKKS
jgi:dTDP-4-amino-4,6-dideoxygalactose transaminase